MIFNNLVTMGNSLRLSYKARLINALFSVVLILSATVLFYALIILLRKDLISL
jgi:hypothetical protein